ncbi:MAG: 3-isopropylmalate dehydratase small subunit [Pseudomonadota bacterium]
MEFRGKAWKFGANIDTDVIIPAIHLYTTDPAILGKHCMEGIEPDFSEKVSAGDIIVADDNFGCGSSREHAPVAIQAIGISCVVAKSFSRIFFRNSINIGFPIFESKEASSKIKSGDELIVNSDKGLIINVTRKEEYKTLIYPDFIKSIILKGGLLKVYADEPDV